MFLWKGQKATFFADIRGGFLEKKKREKTSPENHFTFIEFIKVGGKGGLEFCFLYPLGECRFRRNISLKNNNKKCKFQFQIFRREYSGDDSCTHDGSGRHYSKESNMAVFLERHVINNINM